MSTTLAANKTALKAYVEAFHGAGSAGADRAVESFFAPDATVNIVHPFNELRGGEGYRDGFLATLRSAFNSLQRTAYIALGGTYEGGDWVTVTGNYTGTFTAPWLGIPPTGNLEFLRYGEFHRMEGGFAVESYVFLDIPALMVAAGCWPIKGAVGAEHGYTGALPGPITQDGLQWQINAPERSTSTFDLTVSMLLELATEHETWRPYWRDDMMWYGPAAFGAFAGKEKFAGFQVPFENTFSEWIGGAAIGSKTRHFCRFGDGDYSCSGGWPSLNAVQAKTFLDQPSKGQRLYMRVCDWWRREGDLLAENWVLVDIPHVLLQMGVELFPDHDGARL